MSNDASSKHTPTVMDHLADVNASAARGRTTWLLFMALLGWFTVATLDVDHVDLLKSNPVQLSLFQIEAPLLSYFFWAPLLILLTHIFLMTQHATLWAKAEHLASVANLKSPAYRNLLHSYFFSPGPLPSSRASLARLERRFVLVELLRGSCGDVADHSDPVSPYHHDAMSNWHRLLIAADVCFFFCGSISVGGRSV